MFPDATAYCASKFGVIGFTRALAAETAGRIGVTLLILVAGSPLLVVCSSYESSYP